MHRLIPIITLFSLMFLANCAYVSPAALRSLSAMSPLEADPADIAVAIKLPVGLAVRPGTALFEVRAETSATDETLFESFTLAQSTSAGADIFQIAAQDLDRLRAAQAQAILWETADPVASRGSFSVRAEFCALGDGPAPGARVSILIRSEDGGDFTALVRNAPLGKIDESGVLSTIKPC